jgi:hypothetical protein
MRHSAENALAPPPIDGRLIRALPVQPPAERELRDELIMRLAADRLRDLRDDGVTMSYVARMYCVDMETLFRISDELSARRDGC